MTIDWPKAECLLMSTQVWLDSKNLHRVSTRTLLWVWSIKIRTL